jgi:DNA repair exonuclease SbcCD ATPase subunit
MNGNIKVWHIIIAIAVVFVGGFFARGIFVSQRLSDQAEEYQAAVDRAEGRIAGLEEESERAKRLNTELTEQLERDRKITAGLRKENTELRERNREQRDLIGRIADIGGSLGAAGQTIEEGLDRVIRALSKIIAVLEDWEDKSGPG